MTTLDLELSAIRRRSHRAATIARLRRFRPFDRRSIREPGERDAYWATVQARLAAIQQEASALYHDEAPGPLFESPSDTALALIG